MKKYTIAVNRYYKDAASLYDEVEIIAAGRVDAKRKAKERFRDARAEKITAEVIADYGDGYIGSEA